MTTIILKKFFDDPESVRFGECLCSVAERDRDIVLDCSEVDCVELSVIKEILKICRKQGEERVNISIRNAPESFRDIMTILNLMRKNISIIE